MSHICFTKINILGKYCILGTDYKYEHIMSLYIPSSNICAQLEKNKHYLSKLERLDIDYAYSGICSIFDTWTSNLLSVLQIKSSLIMKEDVCGMSNLVHLEGLHIDNCSIESQFPVNLWKNAPLEEITITGCKLPKYDIIQDISESKMLRYLDLSNNNIDGELPQCISKLTQLESLELSENKMQGNPFHIIETFTNLKKLALDHNRFSGTIPEYVCKLTCLTHLCLGNNRFEGEIPNNIYCMTNLTLLDLSNNWFEGEILNNICHMTRLTLLDLSNNWFCGYIPKDIENLRCLHSLNLRHNCLTGEIPGSIRTPSLMHL